MIKNRIISILLAFVFSVLSVNAFAQDNTEKESSKLSEQACELLEILGLMQSSDAASEREIQRGYAAEILLKLSGGGEGTVKGNLYSDVNSDTLYAYAIERTTEIGYFKGVGGGEFHPDASIKVSDMARLLLHFAGYGPVISNSNIVGDIYKNTNVTGNTTYKDLAHLLYNMLSMDAVSVSKITNSDLGYSINSNLTVMADVFDVYEAKGIVTENDLTALWSDSSLKDGEFLLDTTQGKLVIKNGKTDTGDNIGRYVKVYYLYDEDNEEMTALTYSLENRGKVVEVNILDFDFPASDANVLVYRVDGKEKEIKYNAQTAIIYNGTYYPDAGFSFSGTLGGTEGQITAIDNNSDNVADVLDITSYKTYVVKSVVLSDSRVFSKNNEVLILDPEEYDRYSFTDRSGIKMYIEDFVSGTILSVAKNASGARKQVIKAYVSTDEIEGSITSVYEEAGKSIAVMDEENLVVLPSVTSSIKTGRPLIAKLTVFGSLAHVEYTNTDGNSFALITSIRDDVQSNQLYIRILTTEEAYEEYPVAQRAKIDGERFASSSDMYIKLKSPSSIRIGSAVFQAGVYPIKYRLNSEGEFINIDTPDICPKEDPDYTLHKIDTNSKGVLLPDLVLGGELPLTSDTPVFRVYSFENVVSLDDVNDESNIWVQSAGSLSAPRTLDYVAYKSDPDSKYPDLVFTHMSFKDSTPDKDDSIFVIKRTRDVWDSATEEILPEIEGYQGGVRKKYLVNKNYIDTYRTMNLKEGDAIRFYLDNNDNIISIEGNRATVSHDYDGVGDDGIYIRNISESGWSLGDFTNGYGNVMYLYGYVLEREDNLITMAFKQTGTEKTKDADFKNGKLIGGKRTAADLAGEEVVIRIPSSAPVTVYDPNSDERVYPGTYDEILSKDSVGSNCSLIALRYRSSKLAEVIVFNNASLFN